MNDAAGSSEADISEQLCSRLYLSFFLENLLGADVLESALSKESSELLARAFQSGCASIYTYCMRTEKSLGANVVETLLLDRRID